MGWDRLSVGTVRAQSEVAATQVDRYLARAVLLGDGEEPPRVRYALQLALAPVDEPKPGSDG